MTRPAYFFLLLMLSLAGCRSSPDNSALLKLYTFDCGRLSYDSIELLGFADHETDVRDLAVPCFVVEHELGRLLWEGGLPSSLAETEYTDYG